MPTFSDFLLRPASGFLSVGLWVQIVNNATNATFTSTTATDANGKFTINGAPTGNYTVYTGPSGTGPWTSIGDTNYFVPPSLNDTQVWTGSQTIYHSNQTVTEAVLVSGVDASLGEDVYVTLTANRVVGAPLNPVTGQHIHFIFTENGTGGWKLTWNAVFSLTNWALNTAASALTEATFTYNGTNWLFALNPALGTAASPVQGVVTDWGGAVFNMKSPSNPSGAADPTGVAVATSSINGAITAAGAGAEVKSAHGTYLLDTRVSVSGAGTMFRGAGRVATTIKVKDAANITLNAVLRSTADSVTFEDFTIDGNQANQTNGTDLLLANSTTTSIFKVRAINSWQRGIYLFGSSDSLVAFSEVINCGSHGSNGTDAAMAPWNCARTRAIALRIEGSTGIGILFGGTGADFIVAASMFRNIGIGNSGSIGIAYGATNRGITALNRIITVTGNLLDFAGASDAIIIGNMGTDGGAGVIGDSSATTSQRNVVIGFNIMDTIVAGSLTPGYAYSFAGAASKDAVLMGNIGANVDGHGWTAFSCASVIGVGNLIRNAAKGQAGKAAFRIAGAPVSGRMLLVANRGYDDQNVKTSAVGLDFDANARWIFAAHNDFAGNVNAVQDGIPNILYSHANAGYNPRGSLAPPVVPATTVLLLNPFNVDCTVYVKGGTLTDIAVGGLPTPAAPAVTTATTGGTIATGTTCSYRVAGRNAIGHTIESSAASVVTGAGSTNSNTVTPPAMAGAYEWDIYCTRSGGAELLLVSKWVHPNFVDDGSITPSGAMPGTDTTGNTTTGISAAAPAGAVHTIRVPWGSSIKLTYTVAPTWTWFGD